MLYDDLDGNVWGARVHIFVLAFSLIRKIALVGKPVFVFEVFVLSSHMIFQYRA